MHKKLPLILAVLFALPPHPAAAQQIFDSPDKAAQSLVDAAKTGDPARVDAVLGKEARAIITSGDPVYDKEVKEIFIAGYDKAHGIVRTGENNAVLTIGTAEWPFSIPIVKGKSGWYFDVAAGKQELLYRRIGFNELNVIHVCLAYMDAQNEYAAMSRKQTGIPTYAQSIVSHPGKKDGLYWPAEAGQSESPLGEFIAQATQEGYAGKKEKTPYHGYYYKILTNQGINARGGKLDYIANGKMIGGFALVAWPAKYRNSGVMTFIVSEDGIVYQKDLGADTPNAALLITSFDPDKSWKKAALIDDAL